MIEGHQIKIEMYESDINLVRIGRNFTLTCECGLARRGTRTYLAKVANGHAQKYQYLAFRRDPATYAGA